MVDLGSCKISTDALKTSRGYKAFDIMELHYNPVLNMMLDDWLLKGVKIICYVYYFT